MPYKPKFALTRLNGPDEVPGFPGLIVDSSAIPTDMAIATVYRGGLAVYGVKR